MTDLHHPLINELPEYRDDIHRLKTEDHHFRHLFDQYHEIDRRWPASNRRSRRRAMPGLRR